MHTRIRAMVLLIIEHFHFTLNFFHQTKCIAFFAYDVGEKLARWSVLQGIRTARILGRDCSRPRAIQ